MSIYKLSMYRRTFSIVGFLQENSRLQVRVELCWSQGALTIKSETVNCECWDTDRLLYRGTTLFGMGVGRRKRSPMATQTLARCDWCHRPFAPLSTELLGCVVFVVFPVSPAVHEAQHKCESHAKSLCYCIVTHPLAWHGTWSETWKFWFMFVCFFQSWWVGGTALLHGVLIWLPYTTVSLIPDSLQM